MRLDMPCPDFAMFYFTIVTSSTGVSGLPHALNFLPFNQAYTHLAYSMFKRCCSTFKSEV